MSANALRRYLSAPRELIHASLSTSPEDNSAGSVEFEVDVDLPQRPLYPVNGVERVRVVFPPDDSMPAVFLLRADFPFVPHLAQRDVEFPRQICLYERPWSDERPNWAPGPFIERIRRWLSGTADGTLHRPDQALEPVLLQSPLRLILPPPDKIPAKRCWIEHYFIGRRDDSGKRVYFVAFREQPEQPDLLRMPVLFVNGPTVTHGLIRRHPRTLGELEEMTRELGGSLVDAIAAELAAVTADLKAAKLAKQNLFLVLRLPKRRTHDGAIETVEHQAFLLATAVENLLRVDTEMVDRGGILLPEKREHIRNPKKLTEIDLHPMSVGWSLRPEFAARMNGQDYCPLKIVAIGAGALGSQVINNLSRGGFGVWTMVDHDYFEPHNAARHLFPSTAVGCRKAVGMTHYLQDVFPGDRSPGAICCDYLSPGKESAKLGDALKAAELIVDYSASVSVARQLAVDPQSSSRRISVFLNQRGDELVVLVEDAIRKVGLIWLEAEYMRAVAFDERLVGHFDGVAVVAHRYGNGCRELSTTISQDIVALHAGLAATRIRGAVQTTMASAHVFRFNRETGATVSVNLPLSVPTVHRLDDWTVFLHPSVAATALKLRGEHLPEETGGVLLGLVDRVHRFVAIVNLLPAPRDSQQWPTSFIRGCQGLLETVDAVAKRTLGNVVYVGEWHSHPKGHSAKPSGQDWEAVALCSPSMEADGLPTLMLIVADRGQLGFAFKPPGKDHGIATKFAA